MRAFWGLLLMFTALSLFGGCGGSDLEPATDQEAEQSMDETMKDMEDAPADLGE